MGRHWLGIAAGILAWIAALALCFCVAGLVGVGGAGEALAAAPDAAPTITEVGPAEAPNDIDTRIAITGTGFTALPTVSLGSTVLDDVEWVSSELLKATVPWGLEPGIYALTVENPGGESGSLDDAFGVTQGIGVWATEGPYGGRVLQVVLNPDTPTTAYAVMYAVGVFASVDDGANWEPIMAADNPQRIAFDAQDSNVIYAGGSGLQGDNLRSMDGGLTWEVYFDEFIPHHGGYFSVPAPHPVSAGKIYLGTGGPPETPILPDEGGIYYSDDYGETWVTRKVGLTDTNIIDIAFHPNDPDTMAVATSSGNVFTSTNAGLTWNWAADVNTDLRHLYFDPAGDHAAWLLPYREYGHGEPAELLKSTDPGLSSWLTVVVTTSLHAPYGIRSLAFDSGDIWAAGDEGYKSYDGGATWEPIRMLDPDAPMETEVHSFAIAPGGQTVFAGELNLSMYKSVDGGATWMESYDGLAGVSLRDVVVSPQAPDTVYALTYERGLLKSERGGRAWRWMDEYRYGRPQGDLFAADPFVEDRLYMGDQCDGEQLPCMFVSDDGGENWLEITLDLPYAGPDWMGEVIAVGPNPHVPGRVLAGGAFWEDQADYDQRTEPCGFYASDDYGMNWTFLGPTPPISEVVSISFDASDANLVYAGTSGQGLLRSQDGGTSWQPISFPGIQPPVHIESVAPHPDISEKVYVRLYTYADTPNPQPNLFVSTDAGDTWEELPDVDTWTGGSGGVDWAFLPPDAGAEAYEIYTGCEVGLCRRWEGPYEWEQVEGAPRPDILVSATDGERDMLYLGTRGGLVAGLGRAGTAGETIPGWGSVFGGGVYRWTQPPGSMPPILPNWELVSTDGFGDPANWMVSTLDILGNRLYAGTWNASSGAQMWYSEDGDTWGQMPAPWASTSSSLFDAQIFGAHLYAGLGNDLGYPGELWRTNGSDWSQVTGDGFGDGNNHGINSLAVFQNTLYAATVNGESGMELWQSASGESGTWQQVNTDGFGGAGTSQDVVMDVYDGQLYVGLGRDSVAELWRSDDGTTWQPVFQDGLGDADNSSVSAMAGFSGGFYIGLRNGATGGQVWRSSDGQNWNRVFAGGLGNLDNARPYGLVAYGGHLHVVFSNSATGAEVWRSADGDSWDVISSGGWGDPMNTFADYFDKGAGVFQAGLYIGTLHDNGGQIWRIKETEAIFLPVVLRASP